MAFAVSGDIALRYTVCGPESVPRLVLVNSLGTDCRIWDDLALELGEKFRVVRYDQRGQGLSDSPPGPYTISDHADDLEALLDHLGWGDTLVCGLSIGGMIAMETAARRPQGVLALVLADTADVIGPREIWNARMGQVRAAGIAPIAGGVMERWFGSRFLREQATAARGWQNLLATAPVAGYLGSCAALRDADLGGRLPQLKMPALCICGSEDRATPPAAVRSLADRLPNAEYAQIEGAGHLTPVERPAEFCRLLVRFAEARLGR